MLLGVLGRNLTLARGVEHWLTKLQSFPADNLAKRPGEPANERFAELVSIVRNTITTLDEDCERCRLTMDDFTTDIFAGDQIIGQEQVADVIPGQTNSNQGASPSRPGITNPSTGAGFSTRERSDQGWMIMGFSRGSNMPSALVCCENTRRTRIHRFKRRDVEANNCPGIVMECDYAISVVLCRKRRTNNIKQRFRHSSTVNDQLASKKPVPTVLTVGVTDLEEFDVSRVPSTLLEQLRVVGDIKRIHSKPE